MWLLEIVLFHVSVCVCVSVYPPPRTLIISSIIWCDIDHVWLVKQVLRLFPAFSCFIWHLPSLKCMGVALLTQHIGNTCLRRLRDCGNSYRRTTWKTELFSYKCEWENAYRHSLQLHSNKFGLKQLSTIVTSPRSGDFLLTSLCIYSNIIIMVVDYYSSLTYEHLTFRYWTINLL